jgi:formyltetrahydrofolate deformylase
LTENNPTAILLLSCKDRTGLVSRISNFIFERGGNILDLDEHVDPVENMFFIRVAWSTKNFSIGVEEIEEAITPLAKEFQASWKIKIAEEKLRTAIFVSKYDHCIQDILWRQKMGEFEIEIPLIISNHPELEPLAKQYGIPFHIFPINKANKAEQEKKELDILKEHQIDTSCQLL